jgi:hypothetical protein
MSYGDDIIMSDGFVPDEDDDVEFDTKAYEDQFRKDARGMSEESGWDEDMASDC